MNSQRGFAPVIIGIVVLVAIVVGGIIYQAVQKPATVPATNPITAATTFEQQTLSATSTIPADWKTYRNDKYGFELKYPLELQIATGWRWGNFDVHFVNINNLGIHITLESASGTSECHNFLCNEPTKPSPIKTNWDYLGRPHFLGQRSPTREAYRIIHNNYRYYAEFDLGYQTYVGQILSTFKFISQ